MISRYTVIISYLVLLLCMIGVNGVIIEPHSRENLGPLCHADKRLWISKIDGRNNTYISYMSPCHQDERNITLVTAGTYYEGIIVCESQLETCLYIKNIHQYPIDVRYEIDDITPQNIYIPLFVVSIVINCLLVLLSIVVAISLFGIGVYTGKKSKGITYVVPGDRLLIDHMLSDARNMEPISPFVNS